MTTGNQREQFYSPLGAMADPGSGQCDLIYHRLATPVTPIMEKLYF